MIVGVVKETFPGEARVALVPAGVQQLTRAEIEVLVEPGAGTAAGYDDTAFSEKGAVMAADRADVWKRADVVLQVRSLGANPEAGKADLPATRSGQVVIGVCEPLTELDANRAVAATGARYAAGESITAATGDTDLFWITISGPAGALYYGSVFPADGLPIVGKGIQVHTKS